MLNAKIYHSYYTNTIIRSEIQVNILTHCTFSTFPLVSPVVSHGHRVAKSISYGHPLEVDLVLRRLELVLRMNLMTGSKNQNYPLCW